MRSANSTEGMNLLFSMEFTVWREQPTFWATSACVKFPQVTRAIFNLLSTMDQM